ncbi:MAG: hypothetical protein HY720_09930 [Planctomycetes bacterium]|nr:hypothetical protein [Planctomycetota bacterium]
MQFFTFEWWQDCQHGRPPDPFAIYRAHLESIRHRVPPDLLRLTDEQALHDGELRMLEHDVRSTSLTLEIDGADHLGMLRRCRIAYKGVTSFRIQMDPDRYICMPGFGNFGYDEVDLMLDGRLQHRFIFCTGIEMSIDFTTCDVRREDFPHTAREGSDRESRG